MGKCGLSQGTKWIDKNNMIKSSAFKTFFIINNDNYNSCLKQFCHTMWSVNGKLLLQCNVIAKD